MKVKYGMVSIILTIMSMACFIVPIIIDKNINNTIFQNLLIFPALVLLVNMIPLILQSEILKLSVADKLKAEKCKPFYNFFMEDKYCILKTLFYSVSLTTIITLIYYVIYGQFHIKGMIFHNLCIVVSYIAGCITFNSAKSKENRYRKRDFLFFRSFLLMSLPICSAVYIIGLVNIQLEVITLLFLVSAGIVIYSFVTYKNLCESPPKYIGYVALTMFLIIMLYVKFGVDNEIVLRNTLNTLLFSLAFAVYAYLLTSLLYSNVSPIQTPEEKHDIEKIQTALFNLAPVLTITLLIELMDNPRIIFAYAAINIIAANLVGRKKGTFNSIIIFILLAWFISLSIYTFTHHVDYTLILNSPITWISPVLAVVLPLIFNLVLISDKDEKWAEKMKRLKFLRSNMSYYTTGLISNALLFLITAIIEVTPNSYSSAFSHNEVIFYILTTTGVMLFRGYMDYVHYEETKIS